MKIDDKLILYLEELSCLKLDKKEQEQAKIDLTEIIGYMNKLNELDVGNSPALSHLFPEANRFREDIVSESYDTELILSNAPVKTEEYFIAPKTVE